MESKWWETQSTNQSTNQQTNQERERERGRDRYIYIYIERDREREREIGIERERIRERERERERKRERWCIHIYIWVERECGREIKKERERGQEWERERDQFEMIQARWANWSTFAPLQGWCQFHLIIPKFVFHAPSVFHVFLWAFPESPRLFSVFPSWWLPVNYLTEAHLIDVSCEASSSIFSEAPSLAQNLWAFSQEYGSWAFAIAGIAGLSWDWQGAHQDHLHFLVHLGAKFSQASSICFDQI